MEWHDVSCRRLDLARAGENNVCLSCGSVEELCPQDDAYPSLTQTPSPTRSCTAGEAPLHHHLPIRQNSETRILVLEPGRFEDPICGRLLVVNLPSEHTYEALSYTWADESGDATPRRIIQLGRRPFLITMNCENALRRLRREYVTRNVWVDAICIDQTNVSERGHQVQLMPKIYSGAQTVLIYVGEAADGSDELISGMVPGVWTHPWAPTRQLKFFFDRRYFHRIWVLQEVALARRAELICGGSHISWHIFKTCLKTLDTSISDIPVLRFGHQSYIDPSLLIEMISLASLCQCQDPRDKVFALLGLLPYTVGQVMVPDYSRSVVEVYADLARYIASQFSWARVLRMATLRNRWATDWPSWVPDWRNSPISGSNIESVSHQQRYPALPIQSFMLHSVLTLELPALKMPSVPGDLLRRHHHHQDHVPSAPPDTPSYYYLNLGEKIDFSLARVMAFRGQWTASSGLESLENAFFQLLTRQSTAEPCPKVHTATTIRLTNIKEGTFRIPGTEQSLPSSATWIRAPAHMAVSDLKEYLEVGPWDNLISLMARLVSPGKASRSASETLGVLQVAAAKLTPIDEEAEALWPVPNEDPGGKSEDKNNLVDDYALTHLPLLGEIWARANTRVMAWKILLRLFLVTETPVLIV